MPPNRSRALAFAGCGDDDAMQKKTVLDGAVHRSAVTPRTCIRQEAIDAAWPGEQTLALRPTAPTSWSNPLDGPSSGRHARGRVHAAFGTDYGCVQGGFDGIASHRWRTLSGNRVRFRASQRETGACMGRTDAPWPDRAATLMPGHAESPEAGSAGGSRAARACIRLDAALAGVPGAISQGRDARGSREYVIDAPRLMLSPSPMRRRLTASRCS